ncbi:hypothetical protein MASR1M59_24400 [Melaminivora sp.]
MTTPDRPTHWDTPPDGDFARYVERLSAASQPATAAAEGAHPARAGITASPIQPHAAHTRLPSAAQKRPKSDRTNRPANRPTTGQPGATDKWLNALQVLRLLLILAMAAQIMLWWRTSQGSWPLLGATTSLALVLSVMLKFISPMLKRRNTQAALQALAQQLAPTARKSKKT